jgi:hypothetical protein
MAADDFAPARTCNLGLSISAQTETSGIPAMIRGDGNSQESDARSHILQSKRILALTAKNVGNIHDVEGILRKGTRP